jgi:hypothetical protein
MKLRLRQHTTAVLTGEAAREWIDEHEPGHAFWATAVTICTCGWHQTALHGEEALRTAQAHQGIRTVPA